MVTRELVQQLFSTHYIKRWNDRLRPIDFIEFDKAAHKMFIAYVLGTCQERVGPVQWRDIIEGGLFSLLQKTVLTDLKPTIISMIKQDTEKHRQLNEYVFAELDPLLAPLGRGFVDRFHEFFSKEEQSLEARILEAASILATQWEFDIIERADPHGFEMAEIRQGLEKKIERYDDLEGLKELAMHASTRHFIDLCGQLRFHERWAYIHRIPKTSVLSHCLFVGLLSYLFSLQNGACDRRLYNNFYTGLFHDFPETLTRDIITNVKRSVEGLRDLVIEYEKSEMEKRVYPLLPEDVHLEVRLFTEIDTRNRVVINGEERFVSSMEIRDLYNDDKYDPCEGELVKVADELTAYVEADEAIRNGCISDRFPLAKKNIEDKYRGQVTCGVLLDNFFAE